MAYATNIAQVQAMEAYMDVYLAGIDVLPLLWIDFRLDEGRLRSVVSGIVVRA